MNKRRSAMVLLCSSVDVFENGVIVARKTRIYTFHSWTIRTTGIYVAVQHYRQGFHVRFSNLGICIDTFSTIFLNSNSYLISPPTQVIYLLSFRRKRRISPCPVSLGLEASSSGCFVSRDRPDHQGRFVVATIIYLPVVSVFARIDRNNWPTRTRAKDGAAGWYAVINL